MAISVVISCSIFSQDIFFISSSSSSSQFLIRNYGFRQIREGRELPDLILIDGGIGQVKAARGVLAELGLDCELAGLAKRDEEIWLPGAREPLKLSRRSEALKILQAVRDETHRVATSLNQRLRSKETGFPLLESIDGVGPKLAARIMKRYVSLEALAAADPTEIAAACPLPLPLAKTVRAAIRLALEDGGVFNTARSN